MGPDGALMTEDLELWKRDPVECIKELMGNPAFKDQMAYVPERVYADSAGSNRIYDEMWTADWWYDTQVSLLLLHSSVHIHLMNLNSANYLRGPQLHPSSCPPIRHPSRNSVETRVPGPCISLLETYPKRRADNHQPMQQF